MSSMEVCRHFPWTFLHAVLVVSFVPVCVRTHQTTGNPLAKSLNFSAPVLSVSPLRPLLQVNNELNITCESSVPESRRVLVRLFYAVVPPQRRLRVSLASALSSGVGSDIPLDQKYAEALVSYDEPEANRGLPCLGPSCTGLRIMLNHSKKYEFLMRVTITAPWEHRVGLWSCVTQLQTDLAGTSTPRKWDSMYLSCASFPSNIELTVFPERFKHGGVIVEDTEVTLTCRGNVGSSKKLFRLIQLPYSDEQDYSPSEVETLHNLSEELIWEFKDNTPVCEWPLSKNITIPLDRTMEDVAFICSVYTSSDPTVSRRFEETVVEFFVVALDDDGSWKEEWQQLLRPLDENPIVMDCKNDVWMIFGVSAISIILVVLILESLYYLCKKTQELRLIHAAKKNRDKSKNPPGGKDNEEKPMDAK